MADSKGVIYKGRKEGMNPYKERFAVETDKRTIAQALEGADAFVGVSVKDGISVEMVKKMAKGSDYFRDGQSGSRGIARRSAQSTSGCYHGDRAFGLSQSGEQRSGIPVHFPRCAGYECRALSTRK